MRKARWMTGLLWAAITAAGAMLCLLTGRTLAHAATIAMATGYLACVAGLTRHLLPHSHSPRVHLASGALFTAAGAALLLFYAWHFAAEGTIFINDDSLYHYQQLELSIHLHSGLRATWEHFRQSLSTDYTCLANLILAPAFALTDGTADGFGLAVFAMTWPLLLFQAHRVTLYLADSLRLTPRRTLLLCAGVCAAVLTLPLLHRAALWRQVTLMGLPLIVLIITLTLRTDFHRPQPLPQAAQLLSCVALALLRRWFLFFLAGWLPLWGCCTAVRLIRRKEWKPLLRFAAYAALCGLLGAGLLAPVLSRAIAGNYTVSYAYWRKDTGSLVYELLQQWRTLGPGTLLLIAAGYAWGLLQRRSRALRALCAMLLTCGAITLLLFTRIQNMAVHHMTLLIPVYLWGLLLILALLATLPRRASTALTLLTCSALLLQWGICVTHERPQEVSPALSHLSIRPPVREDMADILAVSAFISETCTPEHPALILMNNGDYDRLTFVTHAYPDLTLRGKVALERTALVSDGFPRMWFAARYILVPTIPQTNHPGGTVDKLTRYLLADEADRFDVAAALPMDGFTLLVMERREPVTYEEYEELLALFADEHALYPAVYGDRMGFFYGIEAGWITP